MRAFAIRGFATAAVLASAALMVSCARNHDLVSIEVTPATQTLGVGCTGPAPTDCGPTTTYLAIGHYIHPSDQHDLTTQVQWSTSNPDLITFADSSQPNVLFPTGTGCGTGLQVRAIMNVTPENEKIGIATVNVNCAGSGTGTGGTQDFTLTPNPTSAQVAPGGSAQYTIEVTPNIANPTPVALSINNNNLPPGISANLNPVSLTPPGNSVLTVTASPTQNAASYQVQVIGSDTVTSTTTAVTLVVQ
jgi:hypothetical protein